MNEKREWVEVDLLAFDDPVGHEAWNRNREERGIFLFEIWPPELNEEKRQPVTTTLQAVKACVES